MTWSVASYTNPAPVFPTAADQQPPVTGEQAYGNKPREALRPHSPPGHVVDAEPQGNGGEPASHPTKSEVRRGDGQHKPCAQQPHEAQEKTLRPGGVEEHAAQLQALPGDCEHQKADPPGHQCVHGPAAQPQEVAFEPGPRPARHDEREGRGLNREDDPEDRHEAEAAGRNQQGANRSTHARKRQNPADPRRGGRQKCPRLVERHGPLQTDEGPEKAAHHQRPVDGGELGLKQGAGPAQPEQPGPQATEQGNHTQCHEAKPKKRLE